MSWNYLVLAFVIQWAVLLNGFWERVVEMAEHGNDTYGAFERLPLNIGSFIRSDYSAATVLISYGAVIGRVSPLQMVVVLVWEVIWSTANEAVGVLKLGASDPGGTSSRHHMHLLVPPRRATHLHWQRLTATRRRPRHPAAAGSMYIHTFGAAFGLALSWALGDKAHKPARPDQAATVTTSRTNGTFAMIGTLFLYCFWPSFNAVSGGGGGGGRQGRLGAPARFFSTTARPLAYREDDALMPLLRFPCVCAQAMTQGNEQHRIVINTLMSISASVVGTFLASKTIHGGARFDMEHIQNATIAGGVAIGACCNMLLNPWGAMLTGACPPRCARLTLSRCSHAAPTPPIHLSIPLYAAPHWLAVGLPPSPLCRLRYGRGRDVRLLLRDARPQGVGRFRHLRRFQPPLHVGRHRRRRVGDRGGGRHDGHW